jgi:hypothetical protein
MIRYTYLVCPVINRRFKKEHIKQGFTHQNMPMSRSDLTLTADCEYLFEIFEMIFFIYLNMNKRLAKLCSGQII